MQVKLTFNKPAASQFFGTDAPSIRVRIEGEGKVMFKPSKREKGRDIFPLTPRTRGGVGITLTGGFASEFLESTKMDRGTHMELGSNSHKWIVGAAVAGKPSKVVPTARLWRVVDEEGTQKSINPPTNAPAQAKASNAAQAGDQVAKRGPGRPRKVVDAQAASANQGAPRKRGGTAEGAAKGRAARAAKLKAKAEAEQASQATAAKAEEQAA